MSLTLNLTSKIEQYLNQKPIEKGLSVEAYALKLLEDTILEPEKQTNLVCLLQFTSYSAGHEKSIAQNPSNIGITESYVH